MKRNILKYIEEYKIKPKAVVYCSAVEQIWNLVEGLGDFNNILYEAIYNAMCAGIEIGYRQKQKDARKWYA